MAWDLFVIRMIKDVINASQSIAVHVPEKVCRVRVRVTAARAKNAFPSTMNAIRAAKNRVRKRVAVAAEKPAAEPESSAAVMRVMVPDLAGRINIRQD